MIISSILVIVFLVSFLLYFYFNKVYSYWKERNVVGPTPKFLFGNIKDSALRKETMATTIEKIYNDYPTERVVGVFRMTTPSLLVRDLDIVKNILERDFELFEDRGIEFSKEGFGANLYHADGETWKCLRNKFTQLFNTEELKKSTHLMIERSDKFADYTESIITENSEQDVYSLAQMYTATTIAACAFGIDVDVLDDTMMQTLRKINKLTFTRNFLHEIDMMYPGVLKKTNTSLISREVINFFHVFLENIMSSRNGIPSSRRDIIDLLIEIKQKRTPQNSKKRKESKSKEHLSDDVLTAQAFVFYAAGLETAAASVAFILYELAIDQNIQRKLTKEVDEFLEKCNNKVTYSNISQLLYLDKVISETLRKYPLLDPVQRKAKIDYKIPGTNVVIKKGQTILVSTLGIHYNEDYYPNPHQFDPERFDPKNSLNRHPCAYMPYGIGPRSCFAMNFSRLQLRVCLLKVFSRFRVEVSSNTKKLEFDPDWLINSPCGGVKLNIYSRTDSKIS